MALEVSAVVGIVLMAVGGLMVAWGLVLCYTTKVICESLKQDFHILFF